MNPPRRGIPGIYPTPIVGHSSNTNQHCVTWSRSNPPLCLSSTTGHSAISRSPSACLPPSAILIFPLLFLVSRRTWLGQWVQPRGCLPSCQNVNNNYGSLQNCDYIWDVSKRRNDIGKPCGPHCNGDSVKALCTVGSHFPSEPH
jgi:hypothetical protein